ncbi:MAG: methyltransferase [Ignavibacteriales bacterium]|nr:methyltransferase [Ignavibacteriales bacterium]
MLSSSPRRKLPPGLCQTGSGDHCALCSASRLEYEQEVRLKNQALTAWWTELGLSPMLRPLIQSPRGRHFRTVTKRKAFHSVKGTQLGLIGMGDSTKGAFPIPVVQCAIEPENHAAVYRVVQQFIARPEERDCAKSLSYVIVRGSEQEAAVIFNLSDSSPIILRSVNLLSRHITQRVPSVKSVFLYRGEERSDYYLGKPATGERSAKITLRKIFGFSGLFHVVAGKRLFYSPLSFSQTNHSILNDFVGVVEEMLQLQPDDHLLDLYCGYGLFSLCLAHKVRSTTGVDIALESIKDAEANALRVKAEHSRFIRNDITPDGMEQLLHRTNARSRRNAKIILDPPRSGTRGGVIETIAASHPPRIIHIICNTDIVDQEVKRWQESGYRLEEAAAVDMFPGTNDIEIVLSLVPVEGSV